jgi:predicted aspartyl protease
MDTSDMRWRIARWALVAAAAALGWAVPANAEFYKYTDRTGKTYYVDEIWKVPEAYRGQMDRYRERYDHLPDEQKEAVVETEQQRQRLLELERQRQTEMHIEALQQRQESERLQQAENEMQRQLKAAETPITIADNQILVPVSFVNNGLTAAAHLVMDTGATHTVVYRSFADRLNIITLSKGQSKVAGGHFIHSEVGKVESMQIGPITAKDFAVVILAFEGNSPAHGGLLGMDFLSRVEYNIDYEKSVIRWKLRSR